MEPWSGPRWPGAMINPTNAVKTASSITRGFMSGRKSANRAADEVKPTRVGTRWREKGTATIGIADSPQRQRLVLASSTISFDLPLITAFSMRNGCKLSCPRPLCATCRVQPAIAAYFAAEQSIKPPTSSALF
jgi:hypothetical protein